MTLLEDIQNAAVDGKSDLGTLLRKCKLLAARIDSKPLEEWLVWESNGYPEGVRVPNYRIWSLTVKGHFSGPYGSGMTNASIPIALLPERSRPSYERDQCRWSIANVEDILAKAKDHTVRLSTGDLFLVLGTKVYQHMNCIQAWAEFSPSSLVELLNAVRNRILDFTLTLWKEQPEAGELSSRTAGAVDASRISQIFNTTIYGGAAQLEGNATNSVVSTVVRVGDFATLERALREIDVSEGDIRDLHSAVDDEKDPATEGRFGPKVSSWIGRMVKKSAEGAWEVGVNAAGSLLAQVLSKYYGL